MVPNLGHMGAWAQQGGKEGGYLGANLQPSKGGGISDMHPAWHWSHAPSMRLHIMCTQHVISHMHPACD